MILGDEGEDYMVGNEDLNILLQFTVDSMHGIQYAVARLDSRSTRLATRRQWRASRRHVHGVDGGEL